jgi:hypothetical protein
VSQRFAASSELHTNDTWLIVELQPNSRASPSTAWRRFDRDQPWPFWNQWWRVGSRLRFAWSQFLGQAPPCWATAVDAIRRSSMRSRRLPKASNRMIPPLRMNAKGTSLPNIKVLGIDSWCPSSRLARKRSERYTDARTTSGRLSQAQTASFAAGNGFHKVSLEGRPIGAIYFDAFDLGFTVELRRIELLTSSMPWKRSTN